MSTNLKICYVRDQKPHATAVYRVYYPSSALEANGAVIGYVPFVHYDIYGEIDDPLILDADVVVFGQIIYGEQLTSNTRQKLTTIDVIADLHKLGKAIAYDCDDLYFDLPAHASVIHKKSNLKMTTAVIQAADIVTVVSPYLGRMVQKHTGISKDKIIYIPNMIPYHFLESLYKKHERSRRAKKKEGITRIGLMGALNHMKDWNDMVPVLEEVKEKYGDKVQFEVLGIKRSDINIIDKMVMAKKMTQEFADNLKELVPKLDALDFKYCGKLIGLDNFYDGMMKLGWDVGLATLTNDHTDKSKSFLKWLDYSMAHIAGVYRGISPFTDAITDTQGGYLANSHKEWVQAISMMIDFPEARQIMLTNAMQDIEFDYNIETGWKQWRDAFQQAIYNKKS